LFYLDEADKWSHQFPHRIGHVLENIIRPYAFFCFHYSTTPLQPDHPEPLNNPIILFFDNPSPEVEANIHRRTFSFGQSPVVVISRNEHLDIYHGYAFDENTPCWLQKIDVDLINDFSANKLITGRGWQKLYDSYFRNSPTVDKFLLRNIIDTRRLLIAKDVGYLEPRVANRLIGRLLFIRYLIDRDVSFNREEGFIQGDSVADRQTSLLSLLRNKADTYKFFSSITRKFDGDLFPLIEKNADDKIVYDEEKEIKQTHLDIMHDLFSCSTFFAGKGYKGYAVQKSLFNIYDFAIIPVELISSIYENFLNEESKEQENRPLKLTDFAESKQQQLKTYYTPLFLVDYILSQTVSPYLERQDQASCKVLDPACGSGIFLVETLRKIIAKEIQVRQTAGADEKSPIPDERLWELVHENIFGIDIDTDAIEITIFSLYITLLDYKTPIEIENFHFKKLKNRNLFGGKDADFFNEDHIFNSKFRNETELDFIIGNAPWGIVRDSCYDQYIAARNKREKEHLRDHIKLEIGNREISQAFMIRVSDFILPDKKTKCVLIVSGKNLYNIRKTKTWRNYLLGKFHITQVFELSGINTKIAGGNQVFESAKQPPAIIMFHPARKDEDTSRNQIKYITARANRFFNCLRIIVVEKHDVKNVSQKYFMESRGGYDWLWKVLLHGNVLDFHFIRRLWEDFKTIGQVMTEHDLISMRGLQPKYKTAKEKTDTDEYLEWDYLETDARKEFQQFSVTPNIKWRQKREELIKKKTIDKDGKIGRLPDIHFFKGKKLLFKRGLQSGHKFKAVAAFSEKDILFADSVCSIKEKPGAEYTQETEDMLKNIAGLINSKLFTYFLLCTSSSLGVDRTRASLEEFFAFPVVPDSRLAHLTSEIQDCYKALNDDCAVLNQPDLSDEITDYQKQLEHTVFKAYNLNKQEEALIDYAIDISVPILKRSGRRRGERIFSSLNATFKDDKNYLAEYAQVFVDHFGKRFHTNEKYFVADIYIGSDFVGICFQVTKKPKKGKRITVKADSDVISVIRKLGNLGLSRLTKNLYTQQDVRGFNRSTFYIIKPNERKCWHKAVAYLDISEFIDAIAKAEIKRGRGM